MLKFKKAIKQYIESKAYTNAEEYVYYVIHLIYGLEDKYEERLKYLEGADSLREELKDILGFLLVNHYLVPNVKGLKPSYKLRNLPFSQSDVQKEYEDELRLKIDEYRILFNVKPGNMGDKQSCIRKLAKWLQDNPDSSFQDVLTATKNYIASLDDYKYMMQADYFIYKYQQSKLSAFVEQLDVESSIKSDWTKNVI